MSKYLGVVFTSDESGNQGINTRITEANAVLRELIAPCWQNGGFQRTQSFQFLNRSLFLSSPAIVNVRWRLKEYCQKNKRQRWDIWEELSVVHFVTKSTGLKFEKSRMSSQFFESRDPRYVNSAMCPKCPRKEWRTKSLRLQSPPTGKRPKVCQGPRDVTTCPTLLGPVLVWSQHNCLRLLLNVRYIGSSKDTKLQRSFSAFWFYKCYWLGLTAWWQKSSISSPALVYF